MSNEGAQQQILLQALAEGRDGGGPRLDLDVFYPDCDESQLNKGCTQSFDNWYFQLLAGLAGAGLERVVNNLLANVAQEIEEPTQKKLQKWYAFVVSKIKGESLDVVRGGEKTLGGALE